MEIELDLVLNTTIDQFKSYCENMRGQKSIALYRDNQIDRIFENKITEEVEYIFKNDIQVVYGCYGKSNEYISLSQVAFTLNEININDKNPKASVRILNTYHGKIVKGLIKDGIPMQITPIIDTEGNIYKFNITWK